jgi:putative FmdB family regulatory protein
MTMQSLREEDGTQMAQILRMDADFCRVHLRQMRAIMPRANTVCRNCNEALKSRIDVQRPRATRLRQMPLYTYRCNENDHEFQVRQRMMDDPLTECPVCGGSVRRVVSSVGVVFKGSGFYVTDNRSSSLNGKSSKSKSKEPKESSSAAETSSSSASTSTPSAASE